MKRISKRILSALLAAAMLLAPAAQAFAEEAEPAAAESTAPEAVEPEEGPETPSESPEAPLEEPEAPSESPGAPEAPAAEPAEPAPAATEPAEPKAQPDAAPQAVRADPADIYPLNPGNTTRLRHDAEHKVITILGEDYIERSYYFDAIERMDLGDRLWTWNVMKTKDYRLVVSSEVRFPMDSSKLFNGFTGEIEIGKDLETGHITDMSYMFLGAKKANPNVAGWDVSRCLSFSSMFARSGCAPDYKNWKINKNAKVDGMFYKSRVTDFILYNFSEPQMVSILTDLKKEAGEEYSNGGWEIHVDGAPSWDFELPVGPGQVAIYGPKGDPSIRRVVCLRRSEPYMVLPEKTARLHIVNADEYYYGPLIAKGMAGIADVPYTMKRNVFFDFYGGTVFAGHDGELVTGPMTIYGDVYLFSPVTKYMYKGMNATYQGKRYTLEADGKARRGAYENGGKLYYYDEVTAEQYVNRWLSDDGETYYFGNTGAACSGITEIGDQFYYFMPEDHNQRKDFWLNDENGSYYFNPYGPAAKGLREIHGQRYYFDLATAIQLKGAWKTVGDDTYYFNQYGPAYRGLREIGGQLYFFDEQSAVQLKEAWKTVGEKTYYFNRFGPAYRGLRKIGRHRYYFDPQTAVQFKDGWKTVDGKTYYFNPYGPAYTGLRVIDGVTYGFSPDGVQYKNCWATIWGKDYHFNRWGVMDKTR